MSERIIRAAIRHEGYFWHLPPPNRHHHVMGLMRESGLGMEATIEQGFLTDIGRFVDRGEASLIAKKAGQLIRQPTPVDNLTTEDLW